MKLVYFSGSILPSKKANSVHVMNMCNSFAKIYDKVDLVARGDADIGYLHKSYGTDKKFTITLIKSKKFLVFSILAVIKKFSFNKNTTYYTRNIYVAGIFSLFFRKIGYKFIS